MRIAYVKVLKAEQNADRQLKALKQYNIEKIFEEKINGRDCNRPQLKAMLDYIREGDTVYVESIGRLARNALDFMKIIGQLNNKNVNLVSVREAIDTNTHQGEHIMAVFAALSRLEGGTARHCSKRNLDLPLSDDSGCGTSQILMDKVFCCIS